MFIDTKKQIGAEIERDYFARYLKRISTLGILHIFSTKTKYLGPCCFAGIVIKLQVDANMKCWYQSITTFSIFYNNLSKCAGGEYSYAINIPKF